MSKTITITYRLPRAELVVSGTVRRTLDTVTDPQGRLADQPAQLAAHAFAVRHVADEQEQLSVILPRGWLRSFKGSFSYTLDRRLVGATVESTGQVGTVLTAAATLAGAALGVRGLAAGGVALGGVEDPVENAYRKKYPDESSRRAEVVQTLDRVRIAQLETMEKIVSDGTPGLSERWDALRRARQALEGELATLDTHRAAWRATTLKTADEVFEFAVPLSQLTTSPGEPDKACTEESSTPPAQLSDLWTRFGVGWAPSGVPVARPRPSP